jgi:uncharacterized protein YndB with AHSA1/START domain
MTASSLETLRILRRFAVTPDHVFDAWLDPERIVEWIVGPRPQDEVLHVHVDARVGGRFSFLVRRDGQDIDHVGDYLVVDRPRRLAFTFDAVLRPGGAPNPTPSVVHLDLVPDGGGTQLTLTHEHVPAPYVDRTEAGWQAILDAIQRAVE